MDDKLYRPMFILSEICPNFVNIAYLLTTMEELGIFRLGEPGQASFRILKEALAEVMRLLHPVYTKGFEVHTDPCEYVFGDAIMQHRQEVSVVECGRV